MNRGSFLKGLLSGTLSTTVISGVSHQLTKNEVKKLSDEQLNELYEAYVNDKEKKKLITNKNIEENKIVIYEQNKIWPSILIINSAFYSKSKKITNLYLKKHLKKLQNFQKWADEWIENHPKTYSHGFMNDFEHVRKVYVTISIIKAHLLLKDLNKAESLLTRFMFDRCPTHPGGDNYGLIYFGDLLFKSGYEKESIEYYNQSNRDNIKRWVLKLEEGNNMHLVKTEFLKRYYSKAYFGYSVYDYKLMKNKKFKTTPKFMLEEV